MTSKHPVLRMYGSVQSELHDLNVQAEKLARTIRTIELELEELRRKRTAIHECIIEFKQHHQQ